MGCGSNVKDDFINYDLEPQSPAVRCHDLRRPLPRGDSSVDLIFSEHFIEHVDQSDLKLMLRDWYRVLKPGGWLRVSTPDLDVLAKNFTENLTGAYLAVNWAPATRCQMMNEGMRLWGHKFLYTEDELEGMLEYVGFTMVTLQHPRYSPVPELMDLETRPDCGDLILQAKKPG